MDKKNKEEINKNSDFITIPKLKSPWKLTTAILLVIALLLLITNGTFGSKDLSGKDAGEKLVKYIGEKVEGEIEYIAYRDLGNLYEITLKYEDELIPLFITKDGKYFVQGAIPLESILPA